MNPPVVRTAGRVRVVGSAKIRTMVANANVAGRAIGRSPDQLTLEERTMLAGKYIALEIYTPATLPMRRIEAIGDSAEECVKALKARGLDPARFEFVLLKPPY
jgi:hypothetical protein